MPTSSHHSLVINEIFHSIQGESTGIGRPCVFVRLAYCDLRCVWCDTAYAFEEGSAMEIEDIVSKVKGYGCKLVEITGGEPLFQENVHVLMTRLCDEGCEVMLETGGHRDISAVDRRVKRIVDIKCPGSKMEKRNRWENIRHLTPQDEIKFVIADRNDYEWAKQVIQRHQLDAVSPVLMSPVFGSVENRTLAEWILHDRLNVRLQLQMHKYIWDPKMRGV
jgi:7-carboxy-7-deazaguanine synthase